MILDEGDNIVIRGRSCPWAVEYDRASAIGPTSLELDGSTFLTSCSSSIDDLGESLALPGNMRAHRKGTSAIVSFDSELPFGAKVHFQSSHRYSENAVRVIKDIQLPRGTQINDSFQLDTLELSGDFEGIRELRADGSLTEWANLPDTRTWDEHPLMVLLRRGDGMVLEIGVGNDIWRWNAGVAPENNVGRYELIRTAGCLRFVRRPTVVAGDEAVVPIPRIYRFTWYMAWNAAATENPLTGHTRVPVSWRPNGDIALRGLAERLSETEKPAIEIDINTLPWPPALLRTDTTQPCTCSSNVTKRLKRVVRQLSNFEPKDVPVVFKGFAPGICMGGRHVARNKPTLHWDLVSILDFGQWARQSLGCERELFVDNAGLDCPSIGNLFAVADHDEDAIHYEWDPPEPEIG